MDKPAFLKEFDNILNECRENYLGPETDIGNWIYAQPRKNDMDDLNRVARDCLYRIQRGISLKESKKEARI